MHPQHLAAPLHTGQRGYHAGHQPVGHRPARQRTQRRFSRPAQQQWLAQRQQLGLALQQGPVVGGRFAKANPGVERDAVERHPSAVHLRQAPGQPGGHLNHHITGVVGELLHRARLTLHVHQADATRRVRRHHRQRTRPGQCAHIVDDVGAQIEGRLHHLGPAGVHRHRDAQSHGMAQHRQHPGQLFLQIRLTGTGAGGFTADVQQVSAVAQQLVAVRLGRVGAAVLAAVGKRIGRDVDDAHHLRPAQIDQKTAGLPVRQTMNPACQSTKRTGPEGPVLHDENDAVRRQWPAQRRR